MLSLTTNGKSEGYSAQGRHGEMELLLWPIHNALRFCGFDILPPFVAYDVVRGDLPQRQATLQAYAEHVAGLAEVEPLIFNSLDDFDRAGRLKPGIAPRRGLQE